MQRRSLKNTLTFYILVTAFTFSAAAPTHRVGLHKRNTPDSVAGGASPTEISYRTEATTTMPETILYSNSRPTVKCTVSVENMSRLLINGHYTLARYLQTEVSGHGRIGISFSSYTQNSDYHDSYYYNLCKVYRYRFYYSDNFIIKISSLFLLCRQP